MINNVGRGLSELDRHKLISLRVGIALILVWSQDVLEVKIWDSEV